MILYAASDLMWKSRIRAIAKELGRDAKQVEYNETQEALGARMSQVEGPIGLVVDCTGGDDGGAGLIARARRCSPGIRIVAFGPHVDGAALASAKEAGADAAIPRGRVADRLGALLSPPNTA